MFDADGIAMISFVFDGSDKGAIIMDDMSIRPAFSPGHHFQPDDSRAVSGITRGLSGAIVD